MKNINTVIGLGNAACQVTKLFEPNYNIYLLDSDTHQHKNHIHIPQQPSHESYENSNITLPDNIKKEKDFFFIIGGSGDISGLSLKVLSQLNSKTAHVVYLVPSLTSLTEEESLKHRVVFGVLQEYVRSGLLSNFIIFGEDELEGVISGLTLLNRYDKYNEQIYNVLNGIVYLSNQKPLMGNIPRFTDYFRICSLGLVDSLSGEEAFLWNLDGESEVYYFYIVPEREIEENFGLIKEVKEFFVKKKKKGKKMSYGVYSTSFENRYCYALCKVSEPEYEKK